MNYHSELMCNVGELSYDFASRVGTLKMAPNNCCDAAGCIALFERIDANVEKINTIAGVEADTVYTRTDSGWDSK